MHAVPLLSRHCRFDFAVTTETMFPVDLGSHTVACVSRNAHWRVRLCVDTKYLHASNSPVASAYIPTWQVDVQTHTAWRPPGGLSIGQQSQAHDLESFEALQEIRYDTIRDAILTCARKPTQVSLIYRTERQLKSVKKRKIIPNKSFVNAMANA